MCLLAIKFPISIRKIIETIQKTATNTFFDTGCLMSLFHCFLLKQNSICFAGGQGGTKCFNWGTLPPMPPCFVSVSSALVESRTSVQCLHFDFLVNYS